MMVMPMGPDFAAALGIPMSHLGIVGGAYTASATVVGIAGSLLLDRWVAVNALASRVPPPSARARYLSAQNAFTHAASAAASLASTVFLASEPSGRLIGMPALAATAAVLGLGVPVAVWRLEKLIPARRPRRSRPGRVLARPA